MSFFQSVLDYLSATITLGEFELPFSWLKLGGAFLLSVLLFVVYRLANSGVARILVALQAKDRTIAVVRRWTKIAFRLLFVLCVFLLIGWLFGARMFEYLGKFFGVLGEPIFSSGGTSITFWTLILTIPVFYFASWAGRTTRALLDRSLLTRMNLDASRRFSIASLTRYGIMVIVVLVGLSMLGIDFSALAVLFGVLGIGVGFGLQNVVSNFFSGIIIILTRPIKENDRILVNNLDGTVMTIRLLSTVINTVTQETIIMPNSMLVNNMVHNYSYDSRQIIIVNEVSVSYGSDLDQVKRVLEAIATESPFSAQSRSHEVRVSAFGDSGINFTVLTWIRDAGDKFRAHSWINLEIWRRFKREGIVIPFPQVDLHLIDQKEPVRVDPGTGVSEQPEAGGGPAAPEDGGTAPS